MLKNINEIEELFIQHIDEDVEGFDKYYIQGEKLKHMYNNVHELNDALKQPKNKRDNK